MSTKSIVYGAFALGLVGSGVGQAHAADLDAPYLGSQQSSEDRVDFGSGWYIRGDVGATRLPSLSIVTPTVPTASNPTIPNAPSLLLGSGTRAGYVASLGGGYQINNWFRTDFIADFHERLSTSATSGNGNVFCPTGVSFPDKTTNATTGDINYGAPVYADGGCTGHYTGSLSSYDILMNGYVDVGTWYHVTPYVGAGLGVAFGHYHTSSTYIQSNNNPYQNISITDPRYNTTFTYNYDRTSSGNYYNFAWALMAGAAIDVYDHTKLDIGYRYLNLGKISGVSNTLYSHEVRAGLRYMIDN